MSAMREGESSRERGKGWSIAVRLTASIDAERCQQKIKAFSTPPPLAVSPIALRFHSNAPALERVVRSRMRQGGSS